MIQNTTPIAVTMVAERWNQIVQLLQQVSAPHAVTDPLIRDIHAQCMRANLPDDGNVAQLHEVGGAAE